LIKVIICDDQEVVCEGLKAILKTETEIEVIGIAYNGSQALELIDKNKPDVILMDLKMPVLNGIQATHRIHDRFPEVQVLVLTTYDADEWVFDAIRSGASGYLLKDTPREELIAAIKGTAVGRTHVDPGVAGKLFNQVVQSTPPPDSNILETLSEREGEILRFIAQGFNNSDIADRLYLSEGTVKNYVSAIFIKLGVSDRTQAAILALRYGMINLRGR
jgi:two-component system, NarL family, response regulator LiaR